MDGFQLPIGSQAHAELVTQRFQMDVACFEPGCLCDQVVDQLNDGIFSGKPLQVRATGHVGAAQRDAIQAVKQSFNTAGATFLPVQGSLDC